MGQSKPQLGVVFLISAGVTVLACRIASPDQAASTAAPALAAEPMNPPPPATVHNAPEADDSDVWDNPPPPGEGERQIGPSERQDRQPRSAVGRGERERRRDRPSTRRRERAAQRPELRRGLPPDRAPGGRHPKEVPGQRRQPGPQRLRAEGGVELALENLEDLVEFYEERERWEDVERVLKQRVELPLKLAELRMLAAHLPPGAALAQFYRSIDQPDRAHDLEAQRIENEMHEVKERLARLEIRRATLEAQREAMERRLHELHEQREHLTRQHDEMQRHREAEGVRDLERRAKMTPEEIDRLSREVDRLDGMLKDAELGPDRRERLERRRDQAAEELTALKRERQNAAFELDQHRREEQRDQERERRERTDHLRAELKHLAAEKAKIREDINGSRHRGEMSINEIERREKEIKAQLNRMLKAEPKEKKGPPPKEGEEKGKGKGKDKGPRGVKPGTDRGPEVAPADKPAKKAPRKTESKTVKPDRGQEKASPEPGSKKKAKKPAEDQPKPKPKREKRQDNESV